MSDVSTDRPYDRWRRWSVLGGVGVLASLVAAFPLGSHRLVIEWVTGRLPLMPLKGVLAAVFLTAFWLWTRVPPRHQRGRARWFGPLISAGILISMVADIWVGR